MKVFTDLHHGALYYSLQLLFEKRLGWELYRPIGLDWFHEGFWKIAEPYPNPLDTAKQYLGTDDRHYEAYKFLNGDYRLEDGVYHIYDPVHEIHQKAITLSMFKEMPIDIVISSIPAHDVSFAELIRRFKPQAKHIAHMGNIFQNTEAVNIMCSTKPFPVPAGKNVVFYHQEFPLDIFRYEPPTGEEKKISSFVNCLPMPEVYNNYKNSLPDFQFQAFGALCPDGTISSIKDLSRTMKESLFGWHIKPYGDGFGHVIHNWYACGRPVITYRGDYADKLAGDLLIDGKTCIDLTNSDFEGNRKKILYWSLPENHKEMCQKAYNRFKEIVNFGEEEQRIRQFLSVI